MMILVVEDDERLAANLMRGLERAGFIVDMAGDGEEAVAAGMAVHYDAIVLDRMLPGLAGPKWSASFGADGCTRR